MVNKKEQSQFINTLNKIFTELNINDKKKVSKDQILKKYDEIKNEGKDIKAGQTKIKKQKNTNEENKSKRTLTGYQLYSKDIRDNVKKEFPEKNPREIMKTIAEKWNNLKENQKDDYQKYLDKSEKLKNINK